MAVVSELPRLSPRARSPFFTFHTLAQLQWSEPRKSTVWRRLPQGRGMGRTAYLRQTIPSHSDNTTVLQEQTEVYAQRSKLAGNFGGGRAHLRAVPSQDAARKSALERLNEIIDSYE